MYLIRNLLLGVFATLFLVGCSVESSNYPAPNRTPDQVVAAAAKYLEDRETQLDDYKITLVGFDYVDRDWSIGYDGNRALIGDHFWVKVSDDDIGEISLQPGL